MSVEREADSAFSLLSAMHVNDWALDPAILMLNHGAFGACPRPVLDRQAELRGRMEAGPIQFLVRELPELLDRSRQALAALVGAEPENLAFVSNATAGVNAVLRSLKFRPGDELLVTNHGYNACSNVARYVAAREGAAVVVAEVPIPVESPDQIVASVLAKVTERTRLVMLDHVTSPTAIVFPVEELVRRLNERSIDVLIDGAHAPGMLPLDLARLGAAYYSGNCHKWLCSPKGAGFLYVRPDRQQNIQPPVISHGYNQPRPGYSSFQDAFDWQGTVDPTPWLCVEEAIRFLEGLLPGGMQALMRRNRALTLAASKMLCQRLPLRPVCPGEMLGSMAAFVLPDVPATKPILDRHVSVPTPRLGSELFERFGIEIPVYYWPTPSQTLFRISAQAYNGMSHYERLAEALQALLHSD